MAHRNFPVGHVFWVFREEEEIRIASVEPLKIPCIFVQIFNLFDMFVNIFLF